MTKFPGRAPLRVALCQINTSVGDLAGNIERILEAYLGGRGGGC